MILFKIQLEFVCPVCLKGHLMRRDTGSLRGPCH